jgi:hypothetical protein
VSPLDAIRAALANQCEQFATVIHDDEEEDILFTFVSDSTDYILTIRPGAD